METLAQLHAKVENLTVAVMTTIGKETLLREIADIERNDILRELNVLRQVIASSDPGTVFKQAKRLGLVVLEPNRIRGQYAGAVVAMDYRASLVKFTHTEALEIPHSALENGQEHLGIGDRVRIGFNDGVLTVSVVERYSRRPNSEKT